MPDVRGDDSVRSGASHEETRLEPKQPQSLVPRCFRHRALEDASKDWMLEQHEKRRLDMGKIGSSKCRRSYIRVQHRERTQELELDYCLPYTPTS